MGAKLCAAVKLGGFAVEVEWEVGAYRKGSTGIGPYEYWGARGYDHGVPCIEDVEFANIRVYSDLLAAYMPVRRSSDLWDSLSDVALNTDLFEQVEQAISEADDSDDRLESLLQDWKDRRAGLI